MDWIWCLFLTSISAMQSSQYRVGRFFLRNPATSSETVIITIKCSPSSATVTLGSLATTSLAWQKSRGERLGGG